MILISLFTILIFGMWISRWAATAVGALIQTITGTLLWLALKWYVVFLIGDFQLTLRESMIFIFLLPDIPVLLILLVLLIRRLREPQRFGAGWNV